MTPSEDENRYVIVECPGAKEKPETIQDIQRRVADIHKLDAGVLEFLGSKAQVRFYPTATYNRWLADMVAQIREDHPCIVMSGAPIHGKGAIAAWWDDALRTPMPSA